MKNKLKNASGAHTQLSLEEVLRLLFAPDSIPDVEEVERYRNDYPQYADDISDYAIAWFEVMASPRDQEVTSSDVEDVLSRALKKIEVFADSKTSETLEPASNCVEKVSEANRAGVISAVRNLRVNQVGALRAARNSDAVHVSCDKQNVIDAGVGNDKEAAELNAEVKGNCEKTPVTEPLSWDRVTNPGLSTPSSMTLQGGGEECGVEISNDVAKDARSKGANNNFKRAVLAAEIVSRWLAEITFGSVKLQKTLFLCEKHLGFSEVDGNYHRHAAGPHDNRMMRSISTQLERQKWYATSKDGYRTVFTPLAKVGDHRKYFCRYWGAREGEFNHLIDTLSKFDTEKTEIIATLYAAWNDFLIDGKNPSTEEIVEEVLNNWHDSKRRIDGARWAAALQWMLANRFIPGGSGARTKCAKTNG